MSGIPKGWTIQPAEEVPKDWKVVPADQAPHASPEEINAIDEGMRGEGAPGPEEQSAPSAPMTALQHYGQTATFGGAAPIGAAGQALALRLSGDPSSFSQLYREGLQQNRGDLERGAAANPTAANIGTGAGIGATMLMPAGAAARGAGAALRTGAGVGAAYGGIGGLAQGQGVATLDPKQALIDTATGAGTGAVVGGALGPAAYGLSKGIPVVARYIGGKLQSIGNEAGLRAEGLVGSDIRALGDKGMKTAAANALQDEGVIGWLGTSHGNAARAAAAKEAAGKAVGSTLETVNNDLEQAILTQQKMPTTQPIRRFYTGDLEAGIGGAQSILEKTKGVTKSGIDKLAEAREALSRGGPEEMSLPAANALKSRMQELADMAGAYGENKAQTDVQNALRGTAAATREQLLTTAGQVPGGRERIEDAFSRYGPIAEVADAARRRADLISGHSRLGMIGGQLLGAGLQGTLGASAGAGLAGEGHRKEGALYGLAAGLAQKPAREMATSFGARAAWGGANALEGLASRAEGPVSRYIGGLIASGVGRAGPAAAGQAGAAATRTDNQGQQVKAGGNKDPNQP